MPPHRLLLWFVNWDSLSQRTATLLAAALTTALACAAGFLPSLSGEGPGMGSNFVI